MIARRQLRAWTAAAVLATSAAGAPVPSRADDAAATGSGIGWGSAALFAGGAAAAFLAHEGCHLAANLAFGNTPSIQPVTFAGILPFFAVSPDIGCPGGKCIDRDGRPFSAGRPGIYTIVMAGLHCQHIEDEIFLTADPALKDHDAPFRKGMLAFNTLTSIAYVTANWIGAEPPAGDLRGAYRDGGAPRHLTNALVLGAAVLDVTRYFFPDLKYLPWISRTAKAGVVGITFTL